MNYQSGKVKGAPGVNHLQASVHLQMCGELFQVVGFDKIADRLDVAHLSEAFVLTPCQSRWI